MVLAKCINNIDPCYKIQYPLQINEIYEVEDIEIGDLDPDLYHGDVYLKGFDENFNSKCFEFFENGAPIDIYKDPRYIL